MSWVRTRGAEGVPDGVHHEPGPVDLRPDLADTGGHRSATDSAALTSVIRQMAPLHRGRGAPARPP